MFCNTPVICYFKETTGDFAYCDFCGIAAAARGSDPARLRVLVLGPLGAVPVMWPLGVGGDGLRGPARPREGFADALWERAV